MILNKIGTLIGLILVIVMLALPASADEPKEHFATMIGPVNNTGHVNLERVLVTAKPGDILKLTIHSTGGDYNTMLRWIEQSKDLYTICTVLDGHLAASAAAFFLLTCDETVIYNDAVIMFHLPYYEVPYKDTHLIVRFPAESKETYDMFNEYGLKDILQKINALEAFLIGGDIFIKGHVFHKLLTEQRK